MPEVDSEEDIEDWGDDTPMWENHAQQAVRDAWNDAVWDEVRGVIEISSPHESHSSHECKNFDELQSVLAEIYRNEWYSYVPFDSGEAVFEEDGRGYVGDLLSDEKDVEEFFDNLRVEDTEEELYRSDEGVKRGESDILRVDLEEINNDLIKRLAKRPELMRELDPRKFEILIAKLLRDKGYEVTLTPPSKDGGRDILAVKRDDIGTALTLVECKRYAAKNTVGIDVVQRLHGVVCADQATQGLVATTSYFTKDAKAFRDKVQYRLSLADFGVLTAMLRQFRQTR
jgi:hypothetical protein